MADDFQKNLQSNIPEGVSDKEIIKEIEAENEKDFLKELKKKNKGFLVEGLSMFEKEKIAEYIGKQIEDSKTKHSEIEDDIDKADEVYRMVRKPLEGDSSDMPDYRSPLTTVAIDVMHANFMNVFFTPKDAMRVIPTEENDVAKVGKLETFGNWSMQNELELFEKIDMLFHGSTKSGEKPYMVHWVKEYGTEIKRKMLTNPANPEEPLYDPDTKEPLFQEKDEQKLLYNGPKLDILSRKDYIQPRNALMNVLPDWEIVKIRMNYDDFLRDTLQGKMFPEAISEITDWSSSDDTNLEDTEGDNIPTGKWTKEFILFFGKLRINTIKTDSEDETEERKELEDEFIAIMEPEDEVLCSLRINKFPLKMRPVGMDYFLPDDEGRRSGRGVVDAMDSLQRAYDALYNQFIHGTVQSNSPVVFYTPLGNSRKEPTKIKLGYMFPTSDPGSVKFFQFPQPNQAIQVMLQLVNTWAQLMFGISDYASGIDSRTDPDAPAKKAELVVAQGNVRLNALIKRKNKTLKDIFKRWFMLYKENMPPNKFMRIAGSGDNPWKFEAVTIQDFALKSLPDFELTGNILNSNKTLDANKAIGMYNLLIQNPLFNPAMQGGMQRMIQLTSWLIDKLDESGLSGILPEAPGEQVETPEEENARFMQGEQGEPTAGEDHIKHIKVHQEMLSSTTIPDEIKEAVVLHIKLTIKQMQDDMQQQLVMQQIQAKGGVNAGQGNPEQGSPGGVLPQRQQNVAGVQGANQPVQG